MSRNIAGYSDFRRALDLTASKFFFNGIEMKYFRFY